MADHRKTLQHGSPDEDDVGPRSPGHHPAGWGPGQPRGPAAPGYPPPHYPAYPPAQHPPAAGYAPPPSSHGAERPSEPELPPGFHLRTPSQIPPPPTQDPMPPRALPPGTRTPSEQASAVPAMLHLPQGAPGWMIRARRLSLALEEAIAMGRPTASTEACIERAWAAWQLDGSTDKQIARVAQLIETAHGAIRGANEAALGQAVRDVADVIWAGLPRAAKANTSFDKVVQMVRALRQETDPWAAAVLSTAKILGWYDAGRAHAAHAIRVALMASRGA